MTSLSKTTGARNGLWAEKGGPFCLLIVFLHGSACSTLLLSVRSMPKTNCCVPYCHASSTRHTRLSWHRLPKDKEIKRQWAALIRNDTLRVDSNGTSVCGLHFLGGRKTYDTRLPSIFPWTPEWTDVVNAYNSKLTDATCHDDHGYSNESRKPALLTLDVPPMLSTCSPAAKRFRRRTTHNSSPNAKPTATATVATATTHSVDVSESSSTSGSVSVCILY